MYCHKCGTKNNQDSRFCAACGVSIESITPITKKHPSIFNFTPTYAGFWLRALALTIDFAIIEVIFTVILIPLGIVSGPTIFNYTVGEAPTNSWLGFLLGQLIFWLWHSFFVSSKWQATPGKKILGLIVTNETGERLGFGQASARYWSSIISALILGIGYLMVALSDKKQGLHDKIAGTLVVKASP